jgi:hypothetical protein
MILGIDPDPHDLSAIIAKAKYDWANLFSPLAQAKTLIGEAVRIAIVNGEGQAEVKLGELAPEEIETLTQWLKGSGCTLTYAGLNTYTVEGW